MGTEQFWTHLPPDKAEEVKAFAEDKELDKSKAIRRLVHRGLDRTSMAVKARDALAISALIATPLASVWAPMGSAAAAYVLAALALSGWLRYRSDSK